MTKHKEPSDAAVLAARIMWSECYVAWNRSPDVDDDGGRPTMHHYKAASLAERLCAIERAQRRHAEKACNGDYVQRVNHNGHVVARGDEIERRAEESIFSRVEVWKRDLGMPCTIELANDPRGAVVKLCLPGEAEPTYV